MEQRVIYAFGEFRLDTETRLLLHREERAALQPKIYGLLLYFLQHPGRLLPKEDIFNAVWKGAVVEDTSLRLAVNLLRLALHDQSKAPKYILTVNKHGYRFLPAVTVEYGVCQPASSQALGLNYRPVYQNAENQHAHPSAMADLLDVFNCVAEGNRRMVFLRGVQGIGKTALLEDFLAAIQCSGFGVLRARCLRLNGAVEPFMPILEALEHRCLGACGKPLIDNLHRIAPTWLYQLLNVLDPDAFNALQPKVLQINTGRMLREGADFFEGMSKDSVFVLILDNAQWNDPCTLDLLNLLVSRSSPAKLLAFISYRAGERGEGVTRIEMMRKELSHRGLSRELDLKSSPVM